MKIIIYSTLFLLALNVHGQIKEKAKVQVKYRFVHVRDTTDRERPYTEELVLLIGQNASAYSSVDEQKQINRRNQEIQDQIKKAINPNSLDFVITGTRQTAATEYYQFLSTRKLFVVQKLNNNYLLEEDLPLIDWKVSTETRDISGFRCQKATTHFKGRDYVAWFCVDFPIRTGPWKLNGLPGLIMQATDSKNEVNFEFVSLDDVSNKNFVVKVPIGVIKATKKDVDKLLELQQKNPAAYAKLPTGKISGVLGDIDPSRVNSIRVNSPSVNFGSKINNPIELPEK